MARVCALTTVDNPYNPITQFKEWYDFDEIMGYHSCSYLARITRSSYALSPAGQNDAVEMAIDEIVDMNILGIYMKFVMETPETNN